MSTVFRAMGELSVAAHRANCPEPRVVLEFATYDAMRRFESLMRQDTHDLGDLVHDARMPKTIKYRGIELVLAVRP